MSFPQRLLRGVDNFQRRHIWFGFTYGIVKKYSEDNGSYQSALITYYALLSLFPMLLVFTTVIQLVLHSRPEIRFRVASSIHRYFPLVGNQLQDAIHSPHKAGLALIISLIITFYGARGGATALQFSVTSLWNVPPVHHPSFPKNIVRSLVIIVVGGLGFTVATVLAGYTAILGKGPDVRLLSFLISALALWAMFIMLFKLAAAGNKRVRHVIIGAAVAAIGIQLVQTFGSIIIAHELRSLRNTTGTFALVLVLIFWLYLQAQIILYGVEVDVVRYRHLFPRGLQPPLTKADKSVYAIYAHGQQQTPQEKIDVSFTEQE